MRSVNSVIRVIIYIISWIAAVTVGISCFNNNWLGHGGLSGLLCLIIILGYSWFLSYLVTKDLKNNRL